MLQQTHQRLDEIIASCLNDQGPTSFLEFEKTLLGLLQSLGCLLIRLFLQSRHARLDLTTWRTRGYRVSDHDAERTLKTSCGEVAYVRAFLVPRRGGGPGVHPLDVALGLTRDAYSPLVIGWFCRLATRVSFQVASGLGEMFLGSAPPASAIEEWVLGLGRPAYVFLSEGPLPEDDGDVLVIEIDGKAVPTATDQELARRRSPRARSRAGLQVSAASSLWGQTDLEFSPLRPRARSSAMRSRLAFDSLWSRAANRADRLGTLSGRERPRIGTSSARVASVWCFAR